MDERLRSETEPRSAHPAPPGTHRGADPSIDYRLMFAANPHPMWVYDVASLAFLEVNEAAVSQYGYTRDEFLARTLRDIRPPGDVPKLLEVTGRAREGLSETALWRHIKKNGEIIEVEITTSSILWNGREARLVHALDITARRRAEQALRQSEERLRAQAEVLASVVHHIPVMVVMFDGDGHLVLANRAFEQTLGWSLDEAKAHPTFFAELYPDPGDRLEMLESICAAAPGWRDARIRARDGRMIDTSWANVRLSDGHTIGIGQDVTERKRLEAEAWQARKLDSIGRLAGGVAHDFNNLLTAILGHAELLEAELPRGAPAHQDVSQIREAGTRARELTRQLLAFGRRQVMEPRNIDVNGLVIGLRGLLTRVLGENVQLESALRSGLWAIKADPSQIEQVIVNLAINARDAMTRGGSLTITTQNVEVSETEAAKRPGFTPGSYVRLCVRDTGEGMTRETLEHLFEPFYTTKLDAGGTGLGLATVYGIVLQSGGCVRVTSEPGRGTTFEIDFPRAEGLPEALAIAAPAPALRGHETVLLVEDDPHVRGLSARVLSEAGYQVKVAASGAEAIARAALDPGPIDLLVTDVVMPRKDGPEVARALRAQRPGLRVLFVSGYAENTILEHGPGESGTPFLAKPFTPSALLAKVREVLESKG